MKLAIILKSLLEEYEISQANLAKAIGYSQRAVSKWVNGQAEPTESAIRKLADYFNVSIDYLLGRTDDYRTITAQSSAPSLSSQEQKLLNNFRAMRPDLQSYYLEMSETFIQTPETLLQTHKEAKRK